MSFPFYTCDKILLNWMLFSFYLFNNSHKHNNDKSKWRKFVSEKNKIICFFLYLISIQCWILFRSWFTWIAFFTYKYLFIINWNMRWKASFIYDHKFETMNKFNSYDALFSLSSLPSICICLWENKFVFFFYILFVW